MEFFKYEGAGNDFVILDNMSGRFDGLARNVVARLCDRRFGIGADGLLLLSRADDAPFRMVYYNQDGSDASFCGNGARCICAFAVHSGVVPADVEFGFVAGDGHHRAVYRSADSNVDLQMSPVPGVDIQPDGAYVMNTGVPHYVTFVDDLDAIDIMSVAPRVRFSPLYAPYGVNVNFVKVLGNKSIAVRTYERGVEAETLACGTGITASAIAASFKTDAFAFDVYARGGKLAVSFCKGADGSFSRILLSGPAVRTFHGVTDGIV